MEILKRCSPITCPMHATKCNYLLDFNPRFDKVKTEWLQEREAAMKSPGRLAAAAAVDDRYLAMLEPILAADIKAEQVRCKADYEVPSSEPLSLDQIAGIFGITRPRVQQIEARARMKMAQMRREVQDYLVESEPPKVEI